MASAFVGYLAINELRSKAEVDNTLRDVHISFFIYPTKAELITCFMSDFATTNWICRNKRESAKLSQLQTPQQ